MLSRFLKAFDSLNHKILFEDLENLGIRGKINDWFKSYLEERQYVVKIGDVFGNKKAVSRGVPQGSVLGPKLYLCYVNDIKQCFSKCHVCL